MSPRRATPPPSSHVARIVTEIRHAASEANDGYRWAFFAAYDRTVRERARGGSGPADPVGDLVADETKQAMRRNLVKAEKLLGTARDQIETAYRLVNGNPAGKLIKGSLDVLDPPNIPTVLVKKRATPDELAASREAKSRREERQAGFGEG